MFVGIYPSIAALSYRKEREREREREKKSYTDKLTLTHRQAMSKERHNVRRGGVKEGLG